jgi:L-asparaginase / beta-aspartyl-peptidase
MVRSRRLGPFFVSYLPIFVATMFFVASARSQSTNTTERPSVDSTSPTKIVKTDSNEAIKWSIAIHGGAGGDPDRWNAEQKRVRIAGLREALRIGVELLKDSRDAIDVVQAVVESLEDNPNFNAGRGAVLNDIGEFSLDASIMDGSDLSCGAVANIILMKNPIALARAVRDQTPHVFLCGPAADQFGKEHGLRVEGPEYFKTAEQIESWKVWRDRQAAKSNKTSRSDHDTGADRLFYLGTVGCVVRDAKGNLAAATSTGGLLGKRFGRVGDSPIIGAGTYANNETCAVSCTGVGELYIKHHIASAVSARMEYLKESLPQAVGHAIKKTLPEDSGGLIAVDASGNIELQYNTPMMARGEATSDGKFRVGLEDWDPN